MRADLLKHVLGGSRNRRARTVDALDAGFVQKLVVLPRDHPADDADAKLVELVENVIAPFAGPRPRLPVFGF